MRRVHLLVILVVAVLVAASAYAVARHPDDLPTVTCRHLLESTEVGLLPAAVVADLRDPVFDVDVTGLSLPKVGEVDDFRHALQEDLWPRGPRDALVCALPSGSLILVRQADIPIEHCYASAEECAGEPTERRTCTVRFSRAAAGNSLRDFGCPDLG